MAIIGISAKAGSGKDLFAKFFKRCEMLERIDRGEFNACHSQSLEYLAKEDYPFMGPNSWEIKKFAGKLKRHVAELLGVDENMLENRDFKNSFLNEEWDVFIVKDKFNRIKPVKIKSIGRAEEFLKMQKIAIHYLDLSIERRHQTVRELMIDIGHGSKQYVHPHIWFNGLFVDYKEKRKKVVVDDHEEYVSSLPNWLITDVRYPDEKKLIEERGGVVVRIESNRCETIDSPSETALDKSDFDFIIQNNSTLEEFNNQVSELYHHLIVKQNHESFIGI